MKIAGLLKRNNGAEHEKQRNEHEGLRNRLYSGMMLLKSRKNLEVLPATLDRIAGELEQTCRHAESDFISVGKELQNIYSDCAALTDKTLSAVKWVSGEKEGSLLKTAGRLVENTEQDLERCYEQVASDLNHVQNIQDLLQRLLGILPVIEKIALFLKVVGVNIGVESTQSVDAKEMYHVVTEEIHQLSGKIVDISESISSDAKRAFSRQQAHHKKVTASLNSLNTIRIGTRRSVKKALEETEFLMQISLEAMKQARSHSQQISNGISDIVMGIQFHDNMSQRVAHISDALIETGREWGETISKKSGLMDKNRKLHTAYSILQLQASQLRQIINEIGTVYETHRQAFGGIIQDVAGLAESLSAMGLDSNRTQSEHNPLFALQSSINELSDIIEKGRDLSDRNRETARHASETASALSENAGKVRRISLDIHLLALNAIVKATHLDRSGATLEVLAQEVRRLSDQAEDFVGTVEEHLSAVTSVAKNFSNRNQTSSEDDSKQKEPETSNLESRQLIEDSFGFSEITSRLFQSADQLSEQIQLASSRLAFLPDLSEGLTEQLEALEWIVDILSPWSIIAGADLTERSNLLADRYTMDKERDIHLGVMAASSPFVNWHAQGAEAAGKDAGEDDKITLFEPEQVEGTWEDEAGFAEGSTDEQVDADGEDLGDNVEFF